MTKILNVSNNIVIPTENEVSQVTNDASWWRIGNNDNFLGEISYLIHKSPFLSSVLRSKRNYATGKGFKTNDTKLETKLKYINDSESLFDVNTKILSDYLNFGNAYLQVAQTITGEVFFYHMDSQNCRVGKNDHKDHILYSTKFGTKYVVNKDKIQEFPIYPAYKLVKGVKYSAIHLKDYESGYKLYGLIDWVSALVASSINVKVDTYNESVLDNGYKLSGVMEVGVESQAEADKAQDMFNEDFKGSSNAGDVLFLAKGLGGSQSKFTPFTDNSDGSWQNLRDASRSDIIAATNWYSVLTGQSEAGKLGQTQELLNTYNIAMSTVIEPVQSKVIQMYSKVLEDFGYNTENLTIDNKPPVTLVNLIDVNKIVKINEGRIHAGLPIDETKEGEYIDNGTSYTNGN